MTRGFTFNFEPPVSMTPKVLCESNLNNTNIIDMSYSNRSLAKTPSMINMANGLNSAGHHSREPSGLTLKLNNNSERSSVTTISPHNNNFNDNRLGLMSKNASTA